ncbi:predicted protein [Plenodomus lingam JN3]|uniref:Predicted protein n=1 Tax=Leptosphaeria maculans (strain JN3 / isolate v23.1.3 / race Av1-4-5-6-7-8) TaxID=985895 RepID=E5AD51_LEPMJ|nr:predicted protein [Plenodomus lingam JN3]CBY02403.1 predicted protein [Plenodomus lingam JN3]
MAMSMSPSPWKERATGSSDSVCTCHRIRRQFAGQHESMICTCVDEQEARRAR